jgi:putative transcriptional regulator
MDVVKAIAAGSGPHHAFFALGYAGWGAGQLEAELHENAWLVGDPDEAIVFDRDLDTKWARAMAQLGVDPAMMSGTAGRA